MKSDNFGPISSALASGLFNEHTLATIRKVCMNLKPDKVAELQKEEWQLFLIKFTASRELELLLNDYGVEKVAEEWAKFIENNSEFLLETIDGEYDTMYYKLHTVISKFIEKEEQEDE